MAIFIKYVHLRGGSVTNVYHFPPPYIIAANIQTSWVIMAEILYTVDMVHGGP